MFSGTKIVSIYAPATGTVVQLNKLDSGGTFEKPPTVVPAADGSGYYAGEEAKFECMALDNTGYDQLETWMKAETPVRMVTYGLDDHILWNEDTTVIVSKKYNFAVGNRNGFMVTLAKKGGSLNIGSGKNLINIFNWKDVDADNWADGWTENFSTPGFSLATLVQSFVGNGSSLSHYLQLIYPIAGVNLFFAPNNYAYTGSYNSALEQLNFAASQLQIDTFSMLNTQTALTASGIYKLNIKLLSSATVPNAESISFKMPFLGAPTTNYASINF